MTGDKIQGMNVNTNEVVGYQCPECKVHFLVPDAPLGRVPEHKPGYDTTRVLPCPGSCAKGIEVSTVLKERTHSTCNGLFMFPEPP